VVAWNKFLVDNEIYDGFSWLPNTREFAMHAVAIHDVLNTIDARYEYYTGAVQVDLEDGRIRRADPDAAVAATVLTLFTEFTRNRLQSNSNILLLSPAAQQVAIDKATAYYDEWIDYLLTETRRNRGNRERRVNDGIALGRAAAQSIWQRRANDGWNATVPALNNSPGIGVWTVGPFPTFYPQWRNVTTFAIPSASSYRAPPPLDIASVEYADNLAVTKLLGAADSTVRSAAEFNQAIWWSSGGLSHNNRLTQSLLLSSNADLWVSARAFALQEMVHADTNIANLDNKFFYWFWRPHHAIRNPFNLDYSPYPRLAALTNSSWSPLLPVNNPEYPAGHPMVSGGTAEATKLALGLADSFVNGEVKIDVPGQVTPLSFFSFSQVKTSVTWARIFGGIHLKHSCATGIKLGEQIAAYTVQNFLKPLPAL
jgi:hypothetical protein